MSLFIKITFYSKGPIGYFEIQFIWRTLAKDVKQPFPSQKNNGLFLCIFSQLLTRDLEPISVFHPSIVAL